MATPPLSSFRAIGFDIMSTLIDEKSGILTAFKPIVHKLSSTIDPESLFEDFENTLTTLISQNSPPTTYATLLGQAFAITTTKASGGRSTVTDDECKAFADALADWPAFPDTVASLQVLAKQAKLVALSNMDTSTLVSLTTKGALKDVPFASLQGGDKTGAFKPDHRVNQNLLRVAKDDFNVEKKEVLLIAQGAASDHVPATELGISSAWIDRYGAGKEGMPEGGRPRWVFPNLAHLVDELNKTKSDENV